MALESIVPVKEKYDESLKRRFYVGGRKQQGTIEKDKSTSPTIALDSVFITMAIKAAEGRDVAGVDLPGAYLSTENDHEEEVLMVLQGQLIELMVLTGIFFLWFAHYMKWTLMGPSRFPLDN